MAIQKNKFELSDEYHQLALGLELPEVELDGVSVEEARLRSEAARMRFENAGTSAEYRALRDEGWPWRQACYIAWAAMPKPRTPKNQDELATTVLGLTSDRAINVWRKKNPMIDERVAIMQSAQLWDSRADILKALIENATSADYKTFNDRKLALEMLGDYIPTSKLAATLKRSGAGEDLSALSDDELAQLASSLRSQPQDDDAEAGDA